jgi:MFS family permease
MAKLGDIRRVLGHRDFRFLWLAQSASVIGDNIVLVALALFVTARTGSATDLGVVLAAQALPMVAFLLVGGVWADRLPRHRVMIATDLVRFSLHTLLAALIFTDSISIALLVVIEVLFGSAEAFFRPAANGLLPQTVPEAEIQPATAVTTMSNNVAEFVGPALATALVLGAGAGWAFALDAVTFLVSAALLVRVRPRERRHAAATGRGQARSPGHARASADAAARISARASADAPRTDVCARPRTKVWADIREGAREVRSRAWVWATLASFCAALFFGLAPWFVLGPVVAGQRYGHTAVYGFIESALGLGTIVGSLVGVGWRPRFPMRLAMLFIMLWPIAGVLYASGVTLALLIPVTTIAGGGIALFDVWWQTALAERIPPQRLSRVSSYDLTVSYALLPLGYLLAGPLAEALGAVNVMLAGSALAGVAFVLGLAPRETRMLERLQVGRTIVVEEPVGLPHHL